VKALLIGIISAFGVIPSDNGIAAIFGGHPIDMVAEIGFAHISADGWNICAAG
jgi:hypothetical protein